jgi:hypothetical protein
MKWLEPEPRPASPALMCEAASARSRRMSARGALAGTAKSTLYDVPLTPRPIWTLSLSSRMKHPAMLHIAIASRLNVLCESTKKNESSTSSMLVAMVSLPFRSSEMPAASWNQRAKRDAARVWRISREPNRDFGGDRLEKLERLAAAAEHSNVGRKAREIQGPRSTRARSRVTVPCDAGARRIGAPNPPQARRRVVSAENVRPAAPSQARTRAWESVVDAAVALEHGSCGREAGRR